MTFTLDTPKPVPLPRRRLLLGLALGAGASLLAACSAPFAGGSPAVAPARADEPSPDRFRKPVDLWNGSGLEATVLFQHEVDRLPDPPYMLRVTELEMSPGASIDPRTHLGPGVQIVLSGAFTQIDAKTRAETIYASSDREPFPVFYTGLNWKYETENRGSVDNRLFMTEILPRARGFLGNQQFDQEGVVHNRGGVRSGPYVQEVLDYLPDEPLIVRVTHIDMGPKAKTPEYTRPGPALFFVVSGQATFRTQDQLFIATQGAGGYYFDDGSQPVILENKPIPPNQLIAVEFLPATLGKQPSTVPTGREI